MTGDAILGIGTINHVEWSSAHPVLAELIGHIGLRVGVLASRPRVINAVVRVWEMQAAMALAAQLAGAGHVNVLRPLGVKEHEAARHLCVIGGYKMTGCATDVWPNAGIGGRRGVTEQTIGGGEKIAQSLAFTHSSAYLHCCRPVASNAIFPLHHVGRVLPWVGLAQFSGQIELGGRMTAACPLGNLGAMASVALSCRNALNTRGQASSR